MYALKDAKYEWCYEHIRRRTSLVMLMQWIDLTFCSAILCMHSKCSISYNFTSQDVVMMPMQQSTSGFDTVNTPLMGQCYLRVDKCKVPVLAQQIQLGVIGQGQARDIVQRKLMRLTLITDYNYSLRHMLHWVDEKNGVVWQHLLIYESNAQMFGAMLFSSSKICPVVLQFRM